jgi:hypothetical protein
MASSASSSSSSQSQSHVDEDPAAQRAAARALRVRTEAVKELSYSAILGAAAGYAIGRTGGALVVFGACGRGYVSPSLAAHHIPLSRPRSHLSPVDALFPGLKPVGSVTAYRVPRTVGIGGGFRLPLTSGVGIALAVVGATANAIYTARERGMDELFGVGEDLR